MSDDTKCFIIHTDGGSRHNPGPAASAYIIQTENGEPLHQEGHFLGKATNNQAEYQAVVDSLEWLSKNKIRNSKLNFFLDSLLVVNQLSGLYKIKAPELTKIVIKIQKLIKDNGYYVKFSYIPRAQNFRADLLVNQTLDIHK